MKKTYRLLFVLGHLLFLDFLRLFISVQIGVFLVGLVYLCILFLYPLQFKLFFRWLVRLLNFRDHFLLLTILPRIRGTSVDRHILATVV